MIFLEMLTSSQSCCRKTNQDNFA